MDLLDLEVLAMELGAEVNDLGYKVFDTEGDCRAFLALLVEEGVSPDLIRDVDEAIAYKSA